MRFELDPGAVAREGVTLTAADLRYGLDHGFLSRSGVVDLAVMALESGNDDEVVVELACLLRDELDQVEHILSKLDDPERFCDPRDTARKWLYLELAAAYRCRDQLADPLQVVEEIYADFDYPPELARFVRYMPLDPRDQPGEAGLLQRWAEYLEHEHKRLTGGY